MPKRQKAKVRPTQPIERKPSARHIKNAVEQLERQNANNTRRRNRVKTPWAVAKDIRRNKRRNAGLHLTTETRLQYWL